MVDHVSEALGVEGVGLLRRVLANEGQRFLELILLEAVAQRHQSESHRFDDRRRIRVLTAWTGHRRFGTLLIVSEYVESTVGARIVVSIGPRFLAGRTVAVV